MRVASGQRAGGETSPEPGALPGVLGPRLHLGLIVPITAEVLAGASAGPKLFTGWTWCVRKADPGAVIDGAGE